MDNIRVTAAFDAGVEAFCKEAGLDKEAIWNILAKLLGKGARAAQGPASQALQTGGQAAGRFGKQLMRGPKFTKMVGAGLSGAGYAGKTLGKAIAPK